jgi:hypothetical protein
MGLSKRMVHCVPNGSVELGIYSQGAGPPRQPLLHLVQFAHPENRVLVSVCDVWERLSRPSALEAAAMSKYAPAALTHYDLADGYLMIAAMGAAPS